MTGQQTAGTLSETQHIGGIGCGSAQSLQRAQDFSSFAPRRRSALLITEAELRLIASAAIIGDSSQPVKGNSTPAASGNPRVL